MRCALASLLVVSLAAATFAEQPTEPIDFNRDIRPILSAKCIICHGPDPEARPTDLRFDIPSIALAKLDSGVTAIVPGHPEKSALVKRITSDSIFLRMPPHGETQLTEQEIKLLIRWIEEGADFERHWAYVPPTRPEIPDVKNEAWVRNPIDRFILAKLEAKGLSPSPRASRYMLARRAALDLTGLPLRWEQVQEFVADESPDAYARLVDRLLASPAYGVHRARKWLDLARYADSDGYANDPPRTIWAYRDYVIRSYNENKPFDTFTVEQIAGDLLPDPTQEQLIATAFHRNTMTNSEGGTIDAEFRNAAIVNRVNTTMFVWMGTTMKCARCHNHKFDPLTQTEYFQLFAIFNQTADTDKRDDRPKMEVYSEEDLARRAAWNAELEQLEQQLSTPTPDALEGLDSWLAKIAAPTPWQWRRPETVTTKSGVAASVTPQGAIHIARGANTDTYTLRFRIEEARTLSAIRLQTLPDKALPGGGAGYGGGNFVISQITAKLEPLQQVSQSKSKPSTTKEGCPIPFAKAVASFAQKGFAASDVLGKPAKKKGWAVSPKNGQSHTLTLAPAKPVRLPADSILTVTISQNSIYQHHTLGRFRIAMTADQRAFQKVRLPDSIRAILERPKADRTSEQQDALTSYYVAKAAPELAPQRRRQAELQKKLAALKPITTIPVMKQLPDAKHRVTKIQHRGNYRDLGEQVSPGVPDVFQPLPEGVKKPNRLDLARWLVSEQNPLTARVAVNRMWAGLFGRGIVLTSENFGTQGTLPTHPKLLDWLAVEFMESGWDEKALLRLIVSSATYRQSAAAEPEAYRRDPDNRWLSRGPQYRLSAEAVRDQALAAAGLLSHEMYGVPVKPPQPDLGLKAAFGGSTDWKTSAREDRYRRGLYTMWRRSNPYPSMVTFNAPNRKTCIIRRPRTSTPLQALVTLNDPVYVEAAQALGRRMATHPGTIAEQAAYGLQRCLLRPAREQEIKTLVRLYQNARVEYEGDPEAARALATNPLGPLPEGGEAPSFAAWTVVGNVLLNLDEFLNKP